MARKGRYLYVCPSCEGKTFVVRSAAPPGKFRVVTSLFDGQQYPSCRQIEQLCYWCELEGRGIEGWTCMKIPDKATAAAANGSSSSSAMDPGPLKGFSELLAFLSGLDQATGQSRQPGNLSLRLQCGNWGLSLTDAETGQYCFLEGRKLEDVLLMAEGGLETGTLPWRTSNYGQLKKPRK